MKQNTLILFIVFLLVLMATACGSSDQQNNSPSSSTTGEPSATLEDGFSSEATLPDKVESSTVTEIDPQKETPLPDSSVSSEKTESATPPSQSESSDINNESPSQSSNSAVDFDQLRQQLFDAVKTYIADKYPEYPIVDIHVIPTKTVANHETSSAIVLEKAGETEALEVIGALEKNYSLSKYSNELYVNRIGVNEMEWAVED